ncbi:TIGR01459 family HAD-type hydrolase [Pseudaestuariivita sp.]|uniref:TIGR01459 family HAD-type hydrolase n=1 Tax=Pseudaestuariivita sp. TaxID=2211669 RepID=UPI0040588910
MTRALQHLAEVAGDYDAIVLDQWGVLHDGSVPYPNAVSALRTLKGTGHRLAVLSNSGKRAAPNAARIAGIGFPEGLFDVVMTSGEALWRDCQSGRVPEARFYPIERAPGDAAAWAEGLDLHLVSDLSDAEAILLMGLPDGSTEDDWSSVMGSALTRGLPVYCSNPDKASPRAGGQTVVSPGALAHAYAAKGGVVTFYGKPHRPIFEAVAEALGSQRLLMVGDSLEHDITGAAGAGWDSLFVEGGLYAARFDRSDRDAALRALIAETGHPAPTYRIEDLR